MENKNINILIGCEESQALCIEFRKKGFSAFSCDTETCSGAHPEWHLQMDIFDALKLKKWDVFIFFPPCTYLTVSANWCYKDQPERKSGALVGEARREARREAIAFVKKLWEYPIEIKGFENPIGVLSTIIGKPTQIIQPWQYGHGETKSTCLWLNNLPKLSPTNIVGGREQNIWEMSPSKERSKLRSKTYPGIAKAMAEQWGVHILKQLECHTN